ncbi:LysR family transcriptional regulator [Acidovorax sp. Leaf160]|uniref:LysR family transcriptional regulator n=1 Tax=Acidovorax sp. Leaf160 TaxID=1736280 RepID=UPI0006F6567E|nr:LysR family transcriptional regulator [Acidovorax sp. Leaf160]KQR42788.1 LysR family transcriptional regulator [Acidovorax sp. Leaf160]
MQSIKFSLPSDLPLEPLRAFDLVVREGTFSAAAERLGLTQPAVSLQVRQLERRLGVRLLERVGRSVRPTAAGAELLLHVPAIAAALQAALRAVGSHASEAAGRVRLCTGLTTCLYLLPPVLHRLRAAHPRLEVVVSTGNTEQCLRGVESNTLDLALVTLPVASRALTVVDVLQDELVAVGRMGGTPALPARCTPGALASLPLLALDAAATTRQIVDAWLRRSGAVPRPQMEFDSVEAIKAMVCAGLGVAILPRMAASGPGLPDALEVRPLVPRLQRRMGLVLRNDKPLNRALQAVVQAITEAGRPVA